MSNPDHYDIDVTADWCKQFKHLGIQFVGATEFSPYACGRDCAYVQLLGGSSYHKFFTRRAVTRFIEALRNRDAPQAAPAATALIFLDGIRVESSHGVLLDSTPTGCDVRIEKATVIYPVVVGWPMLLTPVARVGFLALGRIYDVTIQADGKTITGRGKLIRHNSQPRPGEDLIELSFVKQAGGIYRYL